MAPAITQRPGFVPASQRIPALARPLVSDRAVRTLDILEKFVEERCLPADIVFKQQLGRSHESRFSTNPKILEELKAEARSLGLWNMFLAKGHYSEGAGFTNVEFGLMCEILGKSDLAPEATNNAAPDTGNMEVLAKYGSYEQKQKWLQPLLDGKIRSAFLMTEPNVASSDAQNIQTSIRREGNEYVINGHKWWSSGAPDMHCEIYILMGKTDANHEDPYKRQSMVLVPASTPGILIKRALSVFGLDHAPHGHAEIEFKDVRIPIGNIILGQGRGFEIAQGRLGPGRIHHGMRAVGAAEKAMEYFLARLSDSSKKPFGKELREHGVMLERVAYSRVEIDAARLAVLNAAAKIDAAGAKGALKEIAEVKLQTPRMLSDVADRAIQAYGGAGVCQDTPLPEIWVTGRYMRIVDGPDEVHAQQLGRNEAKRGLHLLDKIAEQLRIAHEMLGAAGLGYSDPLSLMRRSGPSRALL